MEGATEQEKTELQNELHRAKEQIGTIEKEKDAALRALGYARQARLAAAQKLALGSLRNQHRLRLCHADMPGWVSAAVLPGARPHHEAMHNVLAALRGDSEQRGNPSGISGTDAQPRATLPGAEVWS